MTHVGDPPYDRGPMIGIAEDDLKKMQNLICDLQAENARLRAENSRYEDVMKILVLKIQGMGEVIGEAGIWADEGDNT